MPEANGDVDLPADADLAGWYKAAVAKVEELAAMPTGWDGYGSCPIQPVPQANMIRALSIVAAMNAPAPFLSPISGGALQAEWSVNGRDLELVTRSSGSIDYLTMEDEDEESIRVGSVNPGNTRELQALVAWLLSEPRIHATAAR